MKELKQAIELLQAVLLQGDEKDELQQKIAKFLAGNKETRVYVLSASETDCNGYEIDVWSESERNGQELPQEAKDFIRAAEENGSVYSLTGFMVAFNINEEVGMYDYIFITQAY
jgi:hypothetical protein